MAHRERLQNSSTWQAVHAYDCTQALGSVAVARQAVEELRPGMAPDEIAIARRVIAEALTKLEQAEKEAATWQPAILDKSA